MPNPIRYAIHRWGSRLRWPWLFAITAVLFGIDLIVPDFIPLLDEIFLALLTLLFGAWKKRKRRAADQP